MTEEPERKYTHWYRVENKGREYRVTVWKHKQSPELVEGTEVYNNPADALNAITRIITRDMISWE